MDTYDAHEDILVVGQVCHRFEILYVGMLFRTCISEHISCIYQYIHVYTIIYMYILVHSSYLWGLARAVIRIAPQYRDNLVDLV